jgi:hypothetical protein
MSKNTISVSLPSLIHKIGSENTKLAKSIAIQHHSELKRIRRSRNWQVTAEFQSLSTFSAALAELDYETYQFIIKKIDEHVEALQEHHLPLSTRLANMLSVNPNITLAELMDKTHCSLAQARAARFNDEDDPFETSASSD